MRPVEKVQIVIFRSGLGPFLPPFPFLPLNPPAKHTLLRRRPPILTVLRRSHPIAHSRPFALSFSPSLTLLALGIAVLLELLDDDVGKGARELLQRAIVAEDGGIAGLDELDDLGLHGRRLPLHRLDKLNGLGIAAGRRRRSPHHRLARAWLKCRRRRRGGRSWLTFGGTV